MIADWLTHFFYWKKRLQKAATPQLVAVQIANGGRPHLANFENPPLTTYVHELRGQERNCPRWGIERQEIGADESCQIEHISGRFERIRHVRKKYACVACEKAVENPRMKVAAKPRSGD